MWCHHEIWGVSLEADREARCRLPESSSVPGNLMMVRGDRLREPRVQTQRPRRLQRERDKQGSGKKVGGLGLAQLREA